MKFITIPDMLDSPHMINLDKIVDIYSEPETPSVITIDLGTKTIETILPRETILQIITIKSKERIPVQTQQNFVG